MLTNDQVSEVRSLFPILRTKTYLYSCSQGALCEPAMAGMAEYISSWRNSADPWEEWLQRYELIRAEFARFINAKPHEVAVVTSASAGINPIASAVSFRERSKVVVSELDFPTVGQILLAQQSRGAQIEFLKGRNSNELAIADYEDAIDSRTNIVALPAVSFLNGFRFDIAAITRLAHASGALAFVDGYQDCGTRPINVADLDVDFFVSGALKYLLGPPGLAFLYVRQDLISSLNPPITGWLAQRDISLFDPAILDPAGTARRFEAGTPPIPNIYAALPALRFLCGIGLENIAGQIKRLAQAFLRGAQDLRIQTKTPADTVGPLVVLKSKDAEAVSRKLRARNVITSPRHDGVRFSFHVYNNMDDVNAALAALEDNLDLMMRS